MAEAPDLGWVVAGATSLITLYKLLAERRKISADGGEAVTRAALALVEPLERRIAAQDRQLAEQQARIAAQHEEIAGLRCQMRVVLAGVGRLVEQLRTAGLEPVWTPDQP